MKKYLFFWIILVVCARLNAQQDHHYTQFMHNKLLLNPGYAGARGVPSLTAIYRNQWIGFDGSPKSFLASFNSPFLSDRVGIGVTLSGQQIGLQRDFLGSLAYSYDLIAREGVSVRVGIMGSLRSVGMDFTKAKPSPVAGTTPDPSIGDTRVNDFYGNVGAGIYGSFAEMFYVGFSVPRIYSNNIGYNPGAGFPTAKETPHYYGMGGAILPLSEDLSLLPAVLVKYVKNAPVSADINFNLEIKKKVTAGISYRIGGDGPGESVDLLLHWQVTSQVAVGAAYDFTLSQVKDYTAGSIEVMVQADLKKPKKNMSNPRFF